MSDPGSLQNLNDIVLPGAVAWWPPAPAWYPVLAALLTAVAWLSFRALKSWQRNTYRRQALRELDSIRRRGASSAGEIPVLLKRAALSAWPRAEVASLTGVEWHEFLDRTASDGLFSDSAGKVLDRLSYAHRGGYVPPAGEFEGLCSAAEQWIRHHKGSEG